MDKDQFKFIVVVLGMIVGLLISIVIVLSWNARAETEWVWAHAEEGRLVPVVVEREEDQDVIRVGSEDPMGSALERETIRIECERIRWWKEDYKESMREWGVPEGLMRGW